MSLYSKGRARSSLLHTAGFRVVTQASTVLGYVVLLRGMSEGDFGVFSLLYAVIAVLASVLSLGLEQTLRRYEPEYLSNGNQAAAAQLLRYVSAARVISIIVVLAIILLAWNLVAPVFQLGPYRNEFFLFCAVIFLYFQTTILQYSLSSHMLHQYSVGMLALLSIVKLVGYAICTWLGELSLVKAILVDTLAYVVAYIGLRVAHHLHCRPDPAYRAFRFDKSERKRLIRYSLYNNFNDAGSLLLNQRSDNFFIAALVSPVAVGAYAFYTRLTQMATRMLPTSMFENVVRPLLFSIPEADARARVPKYFTLLLDANLLFQIPIVAFVLAFHAEIVQVVFAGKFLESSMLMPVVFAFALGDAISAPVTMVAQHAERASMILWSKLFGIYNVVALLVLVPKFGIFGAALSSGSAELLKNLFIWWHVRDLARWINFRSFALSTAGIWGGFLACCWGIKALFDLTPLVHLVIGLVMGGLFALVYLRGHALSSTDREILGSVLRGREGRILRLLGILRESPKSAGDQ